ncbi:hypothetical protein [Methylobacterium sp. R2-1]|uniref:hypothetical protein n=1 Tax=Methylobacterium sp. R2-1 TaxID=2587064 RepID=UPI00160705FF|nr:hypothetical protein [Methylobacterium sp. R2-1]MBB2961809.1 hypothetical protein [Methylobacterium sp. R2-1]
MQPIQGPTNDNREGPAPKWEDTPLGKRVMLCVSLVVIAAWAIAAALLLTASHWWLIGITVAVSFVGMLIAGIYRLIVHGRA